MFVCLKNIFATEKFDDIILREYAGLQEPLQDIYRTVAAMESSGIRVHRQLVLRLLAIPASSIASALTHLTDIISEYTIDAREGIYGWRERHSVIMSIVSKYKFADLDKLTALFESVIDNISPTYEIEIRTIRELCNIETGLPRIPKIEEQNRLLRKMMSVAPGERVPRHRLIRNLIRSGEFDKAEAEIRIFDKDFGGDGPIQRYRVNLLVARAISTPGIQDSDRLVILEEARQLAARGVERFPNNRNVLSAYAEVGIEMYRRTGRYQAFDAAMAELKAAETRVGDPEITRTISQFERRMSGQVAVSGDDDDIDA